MPTSTLAEAATHDILLMTPGQGTSGFYPVQTLRDSGAAAFPAGTQMFINHPSADEMMDRPEGDFSQLAAVLVEDARYEEHGTEGAGLYSRALIFSKFQDEVLEKAPYTGLSIFAHGVFEADSDGRRVVTAIKPGPHNRVDFVAKAGRGGKLLVESAEGEPAIVESVKLVNAPLKEAHNLGERTESRFHLKLTGLSDELFGEGSVNREERKAMSESLIAEGKVLGNLLKRLRDEKGLTNADLAKAAGVDESTMTGILSGEIKRPPDNRLRGLARLLNVSFDRLRRLADRAGEANAGGATEVQTMSDDQLAEAQNKISRLEDQIAQLQEQLLMHEAGNQLAQKLTESGLPDITKGRLRRQLLAVAPVKEGRIDHEQFATLIESAINQARAELEAFVSDGRIRGHGDSGPSDDELPSLAESQKRISDTIADLLG